MAAADYKELQQLYEDASADEDATSSSSEQNAASEHPQTAALQSKPAASPEHSALIEQHNICNYSDNDSELSEDTEDEHEDAFWQQQVQGA